MPTPSAIVHIAGPEKKLVGRAKPQGGAFGGAGVVDALHHLLPFDQLVMEAPFESQDEQKFYTPRTSGDWSCLGEELDLLQQVRVALRSRAAGLAVGAHCGLYATPGGPATDRMLGVQHAGRALTQARGRSPGVRACVRACGLLVLPCARACVAARARLNRHGPWGYVMWYASTHMSS